MADIWYRKEVVKIHLSDEEKEVLQDYFKTTTLQLIRYKSQAVLLRSKDMTIEDIADVLGSSIRSVERWIYEFKQKRLSSLFSGHVDNTNASKLTRQQKAEIAEVLAHEPSHYGLPKAFWDVVYLKQYVYARFGVVYESDRSYHFLLEYGNLTFKVPDTFSSNRDEAKIAARMEEIYAEILPLLESDEWEVFCSDETRMQLEAITRRAWLQKGERTVVKVERTKEYQNYLGFLNQKTYRCHVFELKWGNQQEIIATTSEFLKLYPNKKVCIIWDNATCHKGMQIKEALSKGGLLERVHLIALPPYAPDHNPIEHVWNTVKSKLANIQFPTFPVLKQSFLQLSNNQTFLYQI